MYDKVATTGLAALQQAAKMLAGARTGSDSLIGYTSPARVEPLLIIDDKLTYSDALPDICQSLLSQFTGYYLQAATLAGNVSNIDVVKVLDRLNPSRNAQSTIAGHVLGLESYEGSIGYGMESYHDFTDRLPVPGDARNFDPTPQVGMESQTGAARDVSAEMRQLSNLSVGKQINVEITDGKAKVVVPVNVRLMANSMPASSIIHILTAGSKETGFSERIRQWKNGEIEFWRDVVACTDLVDAHKKHLMADKDGIYSSILSRRADNAIASVITGEYSIATASNLMVISSDTQTELQVELGQRLSDYNTRKKIFDKTYLMMLVVADTDRDRVTFYYRGIPDAMNVSLRDLKAGNKGNGPDVADILSAYKLGSSPSL